MKKLRRGDFPEFFPKAGVGPVLNMSLMKWEHPPRAEHSGEGVGGGRWETGAPSGEHVCVPLATLGTVPRHSFQAVVQMTTPDPGEMERAL